MSTYKYLTKNSVTIIHDGPPYTRGYLNTVSGREQLETDIGDPQLLQDIYTYWGDVQPDPVDDIPVPEPDTRPTIEDRVADVEEALAAMMYGGDAI